MTSSTPEPLPPPLVEPVRLPDGRLLHVVRDDLVDGGTKRRALRYLFAAWPEEEFVYGGPAEGYAQVAGAYACADVGKRWTVFVAKRSHPHHLTREAAAAGAHVVQVPHGRLNVVRARAREYCHLTGAREIPFGVDTVEFRDRMAAEALRIPIVPEEVWCVAGSGALSRALQHAWPEARHHAVRIGAPPKPGRARVYEAPEAFPEDATKPPPWPSCPNYDAKAWRFLLDRASDGALFWNVAR